MVQVSSVDIPAGKVQLTHRRCSQGFINMLVVAVDRMCFGAG